jgi:ASC-1-like (ASCH) protein
MTKKPLFVPLNGVFFDLLADGRKTYELRRQRGAWTTKNVWMGRRATLSYGYGKRHRLDAIILDVKTADSIAEIFEKIPYRCVLPTVGSKSEAIEMATKTLGGDSPVIAFEPSILTAVIAPECPRCRTNIWCHDGLGDHSKTDCPNCDAPLFVDGGEYCNILKGLLPRFRCDVSDRMEKVA